MFIQSIRCWTVLRLEELVDAAVQDNQKALGITDHGNMYGVLPFTEHASIKESSQLSVPKLTWPMNLDMNAQDGGKAE